jgi:hypothetical protein
MMVGGLLASQDVSNAVVLKNGRIAGAVYGYQVIRFLVDGSYGNLNQRLHDELPPDSKMIPLAGVPLVTGMDEFETALGKIAQKRFGDVILISIDDDPVGVVALPLVVRLLSQKGKCKMKVKEVASSPLKLITGDESILEALNFMMANRFRRVVFKRGSAFYSCTEREFLRAIFSVDGLQRIKDDPESLLDQTVKSFAMDRASEVPVLHGSRKLEEAWEICADTPTTTAIVNGDMIATPWDLVIKPFIERKLEFA